MQVHPFVSILDGATPWARAKPNVSYRFRLAPRVPTAAGLNHSSEALIEKVHLHETL